MSLVTFKDLEFKSLPYGPEPRAHVEFDNGHVVGVVRSREGNYNAAVVTGPGSVVAKSPQPDHLGNWVHGGDEEDVSVFLLRVQMAL
jgi:hypothetical protein